MKLKLSFISILVFFVAILVSCRAENELNFIDYSFGQYWFQDSDQVITENISKSKMYYYKNPETALAMDRNVIFVGRRYTIDIDLDAIMKEGNWDSYKFKKVNPSKAYESNSAILDEEWINESAFDIEKSDIIGKELGHYGVYLKLVKGKERKYKYIGDYVVTNEEYSGFRKIKTVEDWLTTLNSKTIEYCILDNDLMFTSSEWKAPDITAVFLINPNNYVIDFGGLTITHEFIGEMKSSYLDNLSFTNLHADVAYILNFVDYSYFRNMSFKNFSIESSQYKICSFAGVINQSKLKGFTLEVEVFSEEFELTVSNSWIDACTYEDVVILMQHHTEGFEFELPISTHINYSLLKNVLVVNMNKESKLFLRIQDHLPEDNNYVSEGLKKQVIRVYGIDCEILRKDVEKANWYIQGNN
ncbi:MAG: hypothetical protein K2K48_02680 [Anaeroplasmataceae bacterium]|nr:hypothetical protein [Anaeroplasmataceae bacterium]MDE6414294.1 hypothetical protein [Anaeroplasmataceae bacterium]